jgi:hypothetical protein
LLKRQGLGIWTKIGIISFTCFLIIFAHPYLSSISPDLQVTVLLGYLMITAAADGWTLRHPAFILSILVFMVVTKVNMTPFAIMTGLAVVWLNRRESRLFAMLIMPVCIGLVWVVRSLILTGQLLYPFPAIHFDFFSFGVPLDQVKEMHDMIVGWARSPGPGYLDRYYATATNFKWVSNWYDGRADHAYIHWPGNIRISIKMFLWLSIGVILCSVIWLVFNKKLRSIIGVIILAFCTNLVFWFLTGPDFRFASPIFNAFFCVVLVSGVGGKLIRWVVLFFLMLTLPFQLKDVMRSYMKMPGQMAEADWWHGYTGRVVGKAQMIEGRIPSATGIDSLRYFYPKEGDQSRLDVFPAATNRLEGLVFERDMRSIVFRVR